jgi:hypothetical protein
MADALAEQIMLAWHPDESSGRRIRHGVLARIAADVASQYFEGQAVVDGKVVTLVEQNGAVGHAGRRYFYTEDTDG